MFLCMVVFAALTVVANDSFPKGGTGVCFYIFIFNSE